MRSEDRRSVDLDDVLDSLELQTSRLRRLVPRVLTLTVANILASFVIVLLIAFQIFDVSSSLVLLFFWLLLGVLSTALIELFRYDQIRREGDAIFEEISDELEWHMKSKNNVESPPSSSDSPNLRTRTILRKYVYTVDLPLAQGNPRISVIYAFTNLIISLMSIIAVAISSTTFR